MQRNLNLLISTMLLFVNTEPQEETRSWIPKDEDGNQSGPEQRWQEQTVRGVFMTNLFTEDRRINMELQFRPSQLASIVPDAPTYGDVLKAYIRNEDELIEGTKLMELDVINMPRTNKSGDKAGVATSSQPVVAGFRLIDAQDDDLEYIARLREADMSEPVQDETTESDETVDSTESTEEQIAA